MFYVKAKSYVDELDDKDLRSLNTSFSANLSYRYKVLNFYANYYHVLPGIEESFHTGNIDCVGLGCKIDIIKNKPKTSLVVLRAITELNIKIMSLETE